MPTPAELSNEDRKDSPTKYATAKADFNGDGVADTAYLLKSTEFSGEGLWVNLSRPDKKMLWVKLDETKWGPEYPSVNLSMGISVEPPGKHTYACFDEDKDCDFGVDRPQMELRTPALAYFRFESASSLFFWSDKDKRFRRVWTSD